MTDEDEVAAACAVLAPLAIGAGGYTLLQRDGRWVACIHGDVRTWRITRHGDGATPLEAVAALVAGA